MIEIESMDGRITLDENELVWSRTGLELQIPVAAIRRTSFMLGVGGPGWLTVETDARHTGFPVPNDRAPELMTALAAARAEPAQEEEP